VVGSELLMNPADCGLGLKCNEFFALAMKELALPPTPLLLRFFSPPLSDAVRPGGLLFPLRFSPGSSEDLLVMGELAALDVVGDCGCVSETLADVSASFPELPNILFSRPPWEEKLLLLLPATLLAVKGVSR
jgi:hypothetical protein